MRQSTSTVQGKVDFLLIRRVIPYLWPADSLRLRILVAISMMLLVVAKITSVAAPFFFRNAVDGLINTSAMTEKELAAVVIVGTPIAYILGYGIAKFSGVFLAQVRDLLFANVAQRALRLLAIQAFSHIHELSIRFHIQRKTGALSKIIDRGVKAIDFLLRFLLFNFVPLILELLMVIGVFYVKFGLSYSLVIIATVVLYMLATFWITDWRVRIRAKMNEQDTLASQRIMDSLLNFETVKYFCAEKSESEQYKNVLESYSSYAVKIARSLAVLNSIQSFIMVVGLMVVMFMAASLVQTGEFTVGEFVMINAFMIQITMPLNFLGTVYREIRQSLVDMKEMFLVLDEKPEVQDLPEAQELVISKGNIEFRNVNFGYFDNQKIIHDVSFTVSSGRMLAIIGKSGGGKSTLMRLLLRFYDVSSGKIFIDDQDIRTVKQGSLRSVLGVVSQDIVLFNDSIYYNIAYARPDADENEIYESARIACIHDTIINLPHGYQTIVGERGLKLSTGEKQRIAVARAILRDPKILIFDEATASLDTHTESTIQRSLSKIRQDRTVLVIAHRLSTIIGADEILVLQDGGIAERGTHSVLMEKQGLYYQMWQKQSHENLQNDDGNT
jgi:ATP-binding cassette subfamily B protein